MSRALGAIFAAAVVPALLAVGAHASRNDPRAVAAGTGGQLEWVSADSATDAWAVGHDSNTEQPVILHWDGQALSRVESPVAGELFGVSALSPTQAWAVGSYAPPGAHRVQTLVLQWDGSRWSALPSPNPSPFFNALQAVRALSPTDVWVAGYSLDPRTHRHKALVLRWNGSQWSTIRVPSKVARNVLASGFRTLDPISATSALAVVTHLTRVGHGRVVSDRILRWNGKRWSSSGGPFLGAALSSVFSLSSGATWAVGDYCPSSCPPFDTLALHLKGTHWGRVPSPHPKSSSLKSVTASSADDVWAAGTECTGGCSRPDTLILHWNGSSWSRVASPDPSITIASAISPVSAADAWVVGSKRTGAVLLHWDGTTWAETR